MLNEKWKTTKLFGSKRPNSIMTLNVLNCHVYVCVCVFRKLVLVWPLYLSGVFGLSCGLVHVK